MKILKLQTWSKTSAGMAVFGFIELALVILFASLAINSGSLWQWILVFVLLFAGLANIIRAIITHKR